MARTNLKIKLEPIFTHEGGKAKHINLELQLRRSVMSCMLWESEFYESGESIAKRISNLIPLVSPEKVALIAIEARNQMKLRHVPLLIAREMARYPEYKKYVSYVLENIIQRADELPEFLSLYWKDGKQPISAQVKKGLANAFNKFSEYDLGKYNRDTSIKLRDVLFLCHAKPKDSEQELLWKKLINNTLEIPDTWETELSAGKDKKETWERLLIEKKLGALALLRNLRNMHNSNVDKNLIFNALDKMKTEKVLPFRFISAARYVPQWESKLETIMFKCLGSQEKLSGHTVLLIDVSGSMEAKLSEKSDITRLDAACGVGMLLREVCEKVDIFTFSNTLVRVLDRHGFSLKDSINKSQNHSMTYLGEAIKSIYSNKDISLNGYSSRFSSKGQNIHPDRLIVITDEQSHDDVPNPESIGYMINVASNKNGVGYGSSWLHIDGFSESVIDYIRCIEMYKQIKDVDE